MGAEHGGTIAKGLRRGERMAVAMVVGFAGVAAGAGILVGFDEVAARIEAVPAGTLAGLLMLSLVNYGLRSLRWSITAGRVGVEVPLPRNALYYVVGLSMATTPGKFGEVVRLWLLERGHGYRYERTAALLLADRLGDAAAILILCLAGLPAFTSLGTAAMVVCILGIGAVMALAADGRPAVVAVKAVYGRMRRFPRLFARVQTAARLSARLFGPRVLSVTTAIGVAGWFAECLAFHWLLLALGVEVGVQQSVFVFAFSMLVGAVSMLPGGLGSTEATMIGLLATLGVAGDTAVAATVIIRLTTLWFAVALGFCLMPMAFRMAGYQDFPPKTTT